MFAANIRLFSANGGVMHSCNLLIRRCQPTSWEAINRQSERKADCFQVVSLMVGVYAIVCLFDGQRPTRLQPTTE
jgi:hypothetical protein